MFNKMVFDLLLLITSFLGLVPLVFDSERSKVMTYSFATNSIHFVLGIKTPVDSMSYYAYTDPITGYAWMALGIFCLVSPIFLTLATKYIIKIFKRIYHTHVS